MDSGRREDPENKLFMTLQLFAEDEGTGAESNGSGASGEGTQGNEGDQELPVIRLRTF